MPGGQFRLISVGNQVGIGVAGSHFVIISAVAKQNTDNAPYCIPNELICAEIGHFLRLPIPPVGIVRESTPKSKPWFASLDFNLTGDSLPPVDADSCAAKLPDMSTGLLLFDVLIANSDRHRANFAVDFSTRPPRMTIFDHSHAFFGRRPGLGQERLRFMMDRLGVSGDPLHTGGNRHCLLDKVTTASYFHLWMHRIAAIPDFLIEEVCRDAIDLGISGTDAAEAQHFLKYRRDNFERIINDHRMEFHGINQWRLL